MHYLFVSSFVHPLVHLLSLFSLLVFSFLPHMFSFSFFCFLCLWPLSKTRIWKLLHFWSFYFSVRFWSLSLFFFWKERGFLFLVSRVLFFFQDSHWFYFFLFFSFSTYPFFSCKTRYKNMFSIYLPKKTFVHTLGLKKVFLICFHFWIFWKGKMFFCVFSFFLFFFHLKRFRSLKICVDSFWHFLFLFLHCFHTKKPSQHFTFSNVFFASLFFLLFFLNPLVLFFVSLGVFSLLSLCGRFNSYFSLSFLVSVFPQSKTFSQIFCFAKLSLSVFFYFTCKICLSLVCWALFFTFCLSVFYLFLVSWKIVSRFFCDSHFWFSSSFFFWKKNWFSFFQSLLLRCITKDVAFCNKLVRHLLLSFLFFLFFFFLFSCDFLNHSVCDIILFYFEPLFIFFEKIRFSRHLSSLFFLITFPFIFLSIIWC